MKTLFLALLLPFTANAATSLVCDSTGSAGKIKITITAPQGLDTPDSRVTINAKGILNTTFVSVVDKVTACNDTEVSADVTTLAADGTITPDSGQATVTLARAGGTGTIELVKLPKVQGPLRLLKKYVLTNCLGSL